MKVRSGHVMLVIIQIMIEEHKRAKLFNAPLHTKEDLLKIELET